MNKTTMQNLIETVAEALATDAALIAWCQENFTKNPAVYVGVNENNPPPQSAFPIAAVTDARATASMEGNTKTFELDIGFGVISESVESIGNQTTYAGFVLVETFRELGEAAILSALKSPHARFSGETAKIEMFPIFVSYTTLSVDEIVSRRQPRF